MAERMDRTQKRLESQQNLTPDAELERIRRHRNEMLARRDGRPLEADVVGMIQEMREAQDARNVVGAFSPRD